jgi:predicted Zn-dependent protease
MRNKVRSTEECLKRLAVQAYKAYTPFNLNEQIVEVDVTITHENLNIWGKTPCMENSHSIYRKITWIKIPPCCVAFRRL